MRTQKYLEMLDRIRVLVYRSDGFTQFGTVGIKRRFSTLKSTMLWYGMIFNKCFDAIKNRHVYFMSL